ncbi:hypothetical protein LJC69_05750 [Bacteroidales bacterium OttesenSCG-928-K22]|nr:hypothetical protein [Bacteroidales bacterium OttesenSCG-928-L14]MDL2241112.1 hypothetical protein [Bacteroidales bacterium OttesenSCG-928-K22]
MKRLLLALILPIFLIGCEKMDSEDKTLLELAYDKNYSNPEGFYKDPALPEHNIYYINTVSISPINNRDSEWIELSTNDKNEALAWLNLSTTNSSVSYSFIQENETEKYFEFECRESNNIYTVLFRVHKTSYYQPIFNTWTSWNFNDGIELGYYNAAIEKQTVKEGVEYLWTAETLFHGQKVISSKIEDENDYFEVHISSLALIYGDWDMQDVIKVYDNYFRLDKNSRLISFRRVLKKEIAGTK